VMVPFTAWMPSVSLFYFHCALWLMDI
jgi:hypothetical protein